MGILNNDRKGVTEKESLRFSHGYFIFFGRMARCFFEFSAEIGDIVEPGKKGNFGNGILPRGKQFLGISNPKISNVNGGRYRKALMKKPSQIGFADFAKLCQMRNGNGFRANSASYTCGSCTVGTCNYTKYASGTIKTDCTPTNCTKPVASVSCKANYYASGVTCPACPTSYPYSDAGTTSDSYCYASKTSTGSQLACSTPSGCASATCGTCTPGTCDWRDYKSATDTSCTPDDCTKPVSSVSCNTGYYKDDVMCPACTNKPDNSYYTGTASSNACPWECNDGYNLTSDNQCGQFCDSGITHIHLSTGLKVPLYTSARTAPAINVLWNDTICYGSLAVGAGSGLNVKYNGTVYHAID